MLCRIATMRPSNPKTFALWHVKKFCTVRLCWFTRWIYHLHNRQQFLRHYFLELIIFFAQALIDFLCVLSLLNSDNAKYNGTQQSLQSRNIGKRISCRPLCRKSARNLKSILTTIGTAIIEIISSAISSHLYFANIFFTKILPFIFIAVTQLYPPATHKTRTFHPS